MLALIRALHAELKGAYGSPRMVRELRGRGFSASKERVERADAGERHSCAPQAAVQGDDGLEACPAGGGQPAGSELHAKRAQPDLDGGHGLPLDGRLYLAIVLDLFNREIVGGSLKSRMTADIVEYIEVFYNRKRRHSTLGYRSPTQFMKDWISPQHDETRVA